MSNFMQWAHQKSAGQRINNAVSIDSTELNQWIRGNVSSAGVAVTEKTAMQISSVYASVGLIGGAIACLPLPVYENSANGRQKVDHEFGWLLSRQPNKNYSAAVFWETIVGSLLLHGDGFAEILRPSLVSTRVIGLVWHHKRDVTVKKQAGTLFYVVNEEGRSRTILDADMLHIPGPGFNGKNGMSQISYVLKNSAGIALAADQYSGEFFANGARPDFALEFPGNLTEEQQKMVRESWSNRHQGTSNRHLPALMAGVAKVHELTMNAEDAQLISTRQFQVEDIARIFGVPPHMIGHTVKSSSWGTGVEQMSIGFVKYTLARHLVKIEQELNRKLFPNSRRNFVEFSTAGLERGDYKTRMEGYRIAAGRAGEPGWMTVNEIRKLENQPPIDGGDTLNTGMNNAPNAATAGA